MTQAALIKRFIFTALPCEAKPLVSHFKLKKDPSSHPFALYYNDDTVLAVSGFGKIAMAATLAYSLAKFTHSQHPVLVNVGIAGHKTAALGELFAVHKITDVETKKNFYPQLVAKLPCKTLAINTVSTPETNYNDESLYDMEASAFYEIAVRFSNAELIQAFKVVSDNQHSDITQINAAAASSWIAAQSDNIAEGIQRLQKLADALEITASPYYQTAIANRHFTVTAELQLKGLLQRWQVLTNGAALDFSALEAKNSKAVLQWLEQKINALEFYL